MLNNKFKTGYYGIDKNIVFSQDDLICLAARPAMGCTTFALNIMQNNKELKGCFISLVDSKYQLQQKLNVINAKHSLDKEIQTNRIIDIPIKILELPTTIELAEYLASIAEKYDYFVIDNLSYIDQDTNAIFSKNKNYQTIVRHLKAACFLMQKNIILLSSISREIEENSKFSFSYFGIREKYFDHIITISRPEYYAIDEDEFGKQYKEGETIVCIAKTKTENVGSVTSLTFDRESLVFN